MAKILEILAALSIAGSANAQSVTGSVTNRRDSAPLTDVLVSLIDTTANGVLLIINRTGGRSALTQIVPRDPAATIEPPAPLL